MSAPMFSLIAFDADDTLWHNERLFHATEANFAALIGHHHDPEWIRERLFKTESKNLQHFGYGIKGFTLSMIETALDLTEDRVTGKEIRQILEWGREMLMAPVDLLDGVRDTVRELSKHHRLMLLTKGDLFDQESKLARSGLGEHFHAVEIVSEKNRECYASIMRKHAVRPDEFLMIGNSLRSDVLPVLEAGGSAIHIPYEFTWIGERVPEEALQGKVFARLERISEVPAWLESHD